MWVNRGQSKNRIKQKNKILEVKIDIKIDSDSGERFSGKFYVENDDKQFFEYRQSIPKGIPNKYFILSAIKGKLNFLLYSFYLYLP